MKRDSSGDRPRNSEAEPTFQPRRSSCFFFVLFIVSHAPDVATAAPLWLHRAIQGVVRQRRGIELKPRLLIFAGCILFAAAGVGIGFSQVCSDNRSRDEEIRDYKRTITASERRADKARTAIAVLTQTPER